MPTTSSACAAKIALIYPPTCDPTMPYISVPLLTAYLRHHNVEVIPIDANIEAWRWWLQPERLRTLGQIISQRWQHLDRQSSLSHVQQLAYLHLWEGLALASWVPDQIAEAVDTMCDAARFFDAKRYDRAATTLDGAADLISAAYTPTHIDFQSYRTPFAQLTLEQIRADAQPQLDPFSAYFTETLIPRLQCEKVQMIGISIAFPGQIQPAWSLAYHLRHAMPNTSLIAGGPAISQMLTRLPLARQQEFLDVWDCIVVGEGERALLEWVQCAASGHIYRGIRTGSSADMSGDLPPPDFSGLPLSLYLSPELVLPYDATRGCYWGRCAFCHYGPVEYGTSCYRERPVPACSEHLRYLAAQWGARIFYLSHDCIAPRTAHMLARDMSGRGTSLRWATDMRPERTISAEMARDMAAGGLLAVSLGIESAAPRILDLIHKGIAVENMHSAIENLAAAGIAVEAMTFTDFPSESTQEALQTVQFLLHHAPHLALLIVGRFYLTAGAAIAHHPERYGVAEIFRVRGDDLHTSLFYRETHTAKSATDSERVDQAVASLARKWRLRRYPWAGSLSTAHTLLWYDRCGINIFKQLATQRMWDPTPISLPHSRYKIENMAAHAEAAEQDIWHTLIHEQRTVSPKSYRTMAEHLPLAYPTQPQRARRQRHFPKVR